MIKKVFFEGSERKETFLEQKYMGLKKTQKFAFFQKGQSMVFVKKRRFFNLQFLCKINQEKVFGEGSDRKEPFYTKKTSTEQTIKICNFQRDQSMVFVKKWRFFNLQFLCKIGEEKVFFEGSERKEAFLDLKNIGLKKHQNFHFFKGVSPWFLSKNGDVLIFTFYAKQIKKQCFLTVPKEKKPFQIIKTWAQKTTKICIFTNGLVHGFCEEMEILKS